MASQSLMRSVAENEGLCWAAVTRTREETPGQAQMKAPAGETGA